MCVRKRDTGHESIQDCVDIATQGLEGNVKKSKDRLIIAVNYNMSNINIDRKTIKTKKQKREEKQLYGYFKRQTNKISHEKTRTCIKKERT